MMERNTGDIVIPINKIITKETIISFCNYYYSACAKYKTSNISFDEWIKYIICEIEEKYNVIINIVDISMLRNMNTIEQTYILYQALLKNYAIDREDILNRVKQIIDKYFHSFNGVL